MARRRQTARLRHFDVLLLDFYVARRNGTCLWQISVFNRRHRPPEAVPRRRNAVGELVLGDLHRRASTRHAGGGACQPDRPHPRRDLCHRGRDGFSGGVRSGFRNNTGHFLWSIRCRHGATIPDSVVVAEPLRRGDGHVDVHDVLLVSVWSLRLQLAGWLPVPVRRPRFTTLLHARERVHVCDDLCAAVLQRCTVRARLSASTGDIGRLCRKRR